MSWKKERDNLIAQTMAFVQSVTGRKEEAGRIGAEPPPAPHDLPVLAELDLLRPVPEKVATLETIEVAEPRPGVSANASRPNVPADKVGDMANEIRARIASFRAHQERFNREREEYFSKTLAKLRAAINEAPPPRVDK